MLPTTPLHLTDRGIAALRAGDEQHARELLVQATQLDPSNERAWLWLAGTTTDRAERTHYLQQVLALNPSSAAARQGLAELSVTVPPPLPELPSILPPPNEASNEETATTPQQAAPTPEPPPPAPMLPRGADDPFTVEFIVGELRLGRSQSEVMRDVSDRLGGTWSEAEALVQYVQRQHRGAIRTGSNWLYLMIGGLVLVGAFVLGGLYLFGKTLPPDATVRTLANKEIMRGMFAIAGGAFTMMGALLDLDWFINNRRAYFIVKIFGRTAARVFYFILGGILVVAGAMAMGMR